MDIIGMDIISHCWSDLCTECITQLYSKNETTTPIVLDIQSKKSLRECRISVVKNYSVADALRKSFLHC